MSKDASDSIDLAALPDEPALLKQLLRRSSRTLIRRIREEAAEQHRTSSSGERQAAIDAAVQAAVIRPFCGAITARAREKFDPRQLLLFGQRD